MMLVIFGFSHIHASNLLLRLSITQTNAIIKYCLNSTKDKDVFMCVCVCVCLNAYGHVSVCACVCVTSDSNKARISD